MEMSHNSTTKVLFLCHGNICRSPMAEFIFKQMVAQRGLSGRFEVASAAVSAEEEGNPIYPPARRTLQQHGVPFTHRTARRVEEAEYGRYDLIVCMDRSNLRWLSHIFGDADPEGKVHLLMEFAGECRDVADPWYTGDFEVTYNDIVAGCKGLLEWCV